MEGQAVNPGNPVISHHVLRRQPPIAPKNKYCKRKEKKIPGKSELLLSACLNLSWFYKLSNFVTLCKITGTVSSARENTLSEMS